MKQLTFCLACKRGLFPGHRHMPRPEGVPQFIKIPVRRAREP